MGPTDAWRDRQEIVAGCRKRRLHALRTIIYEGQEDQQNMRLSMTLNGATPIVASVPGPGYLSAHLNMKDRPNENESGISIAISGFETEETETVSVKWPILDLSVGDVVELRVLPEGEGNAPIRVRRSSESPYNLFSRTELAKELLQVVSEFERRLTELLRKSEEWNRLTNTRNSLPLMPLSPGNSARTFCIPCTGGIR